MRKITRPVNMFQNLQPRLSAVSGMLHEVIKFLEI